MTRLYSFWCKSKLHQPRPKAPSCKPLLSQCRTARPWNVTDAPMMQLVAPLPSVENTTLFEHLKCLTLDVSSYLQILKSTWTRSNRFAPCLKNSKPLGKRINGIFCCLFQMILGPFNDMPFYPSFVDTRGKGWDQQLRLPFWARHFECPGPWMTALRWVEPQRCENFHKKKPPQHTSDI